MRACGSVRAGRPIVRQTLWVCGWQALIAVVVVTVGAAGPVEAQTTQLTPRLSVAPKVGLTVPAGKFSDYVDAGPSANLRLSYQLGASAALTADVGHDRYRGAKLMGGWREAPAMRARRIMGGIESRVGDWSETYPWGVMMEIGAGVTSFRSDPFQSRGEQTRFEQTYLTTGGGLQLGYFITPALEVVADGKLHWSFARKDDFQPLVGLAPTWLKPIDSAVAMPITIALRAWL